MAKTVNLRGNPITLNGDFPKKGEKAKPFSLVANDLSDKTLSDYQGKRKVLNIFPSVDTDVCAMSVRTFNQMVNDLDNTIVLCISSDLPFAQKRFCAAEGLNNVVTLSTMRGAQFKQNYGVAMVNGPLAGLAARAVIILDEHDTVIYSQLVDEISHEPDYEAALTVLK